MEKIDNDQVYIVNMDYEFNLTHKKTKFKGKLLSEFEYIFFFIENGEKKLLSSVVYDEKYLHRLRDFGFNIPVIISKSLVEPTNWWGSLDLKNLELERKLNSKIKSLEIAKKLQLCPTEVALIESDKAYEEYMTSSHLEGMHLLKEEFGFSGIGHKIIRLRNEEIKISRPRIIAPLYERVLDIGISFDLTNDTYFIIQNFITKDFKFCGGLYIGDSGKLASLFNFVNEDELSQKILSMLNYFKNIGVKSNISVDMFYYKEKNEIKPYYMVEINYRKTMGLMIKALSFTSRLPYTAWLIFSKKNIKEEIDDYISEVNKSKRCSILVTSPKTSFFQSISFNSLTIQELTLCIADFSSHCLDSDNKFFIEVNGQLPAGL